MSTLDHLEESVDDYSQPKNPTSYQCVSPGGQHLHGIHDSRKNFYSYTYTNGRMESPKFSDDIILDLRKGINPIKAQNLFRQEMIRRMERSPYYSDDAGVTSQDRHNYATIMLTLREKIVEILIGKGVVPDAYHTYPRPYSSGQDSHMFYTTLDYHEGCSNPKGRRVAEVNALVEAKKSLGGLYSHLQILPNFPYGMPIDNNSYNNTYYVDTGQIEAPCHDGYTRSEMGHFTPSPQACRLLPDQL